MGLRTITGSVYKMKNNAINGWLTSNECCELLSCSYWYFIRNVQDKIPSAQPAGRYGQRFFREESVLKLRSREGLMGNKAIEDESNWVETPADMEAGIDTFIGEKIGMMHVGEYVWHSVSAAIECMEKSEDLRALMLLRTLRHFLSKATGHEVPE